MDDTKIYGLCITRLKHQIETARKTGRAKGSGSHAPLPRILLESYMTAEVDEIIDILELYDINERTPEHLKRMLEDLAYTASLLTREDLSFGLTEKGHLGLFLGLKGLRTRWAEEDANAYVPAEILS